MIVIPMVGRSRRFFEAGYTTSKYRLPLAGHSVFALAVGGFAAVAQQEDLLVICLAEDEAAGFAREQLAALGIARGRVVELPRMTLGQADTVSQGLAADATPRREPITIFNIDTFRPDFRYPSAFDTHQVDGYLECFIGSGANWSNAVPVAPGSNRVARTSEKKQESEFCCTGLYHFASVDLFDRAYAAEQRAASAGQQQAAELFVAPIYNHLIAEGHDIRLEVIGSDEVIFCGVPAEYRALQDSPPASLLAHARKLGGGR